MSTFQTINEQIITPPFDIDIQNLDISSDHWLGIKYLSALANELDLILYAKSTFEVAEKELIKYWLDMIKSNPRIERIQVYTDKKEKNKLICLCVSEIQTFKPENVCKRLVTMHFKKQDKTVVFVDVTKKEFEDINKKSVLLPDNWQLHEALTNKIEKYKSLFL